VIFILVVQNLTQLYRRATAFPIANETTNSRGKDKERYSHLRETLYYWSAWPIRRQLPFIAYSHVEITPDLLKLVVQKDDYVVLHNLRWDVV
jgi:hypothetical protein